MSASLTSGTYPRGAAQHGPISAVASSFARWAGLMWRGLQAVGASRARQHLLSAATQCQYSNPALARQLRQCADEVGNV